MENCIIVTGGAGFIGSNYILNRLANSDTAVVNLDKLTYAGNLFNLSSEENNPAYTFIQGDICNRRLIDDLLDRFKPAAIINFAAESHVDRSIHGPEDFIITNVNGTFHLLEAARTYWDGLNSKGQDEFRFLHVSTDEVYGSLSADDPPFTEQSPYAPNSPYSSSKAASDHLVRAYYHTYGLPTLTTNCSNNYGPYQFPEKLIPLVILNAMNGRKLPVYGDGLNIRDWLYVTDHCDAIDTVLSGGRTGEVYNIGGWNEKSNLDVVKTVCGILDELLPDSDYRPHEQLIEFVRDRPGHDRRYAINATKIQHELGWTPAQTFDSGIEKTVRWYLENQEWIQRVASGAYRDWVTKQYS